MSGDIHTKTKADSVLGSVLSDSLPTQRYSVKSLSHFPIYSVLCRFYQTGATGDLMGSIFSSGLHIFGAVVRVCGSRTLCVCVCVCVCDWF